MTTLVEFIAPLKNATQKVKVLSVMYFKHKYEGVEDLSYNDVRLALKSTRMRGATKINVPKVLRKTGHYADYRIEDGKTRLWRLTGTGEDYVCDILDLQLSEPEVIQDIGTLGKVVAAIADDEIRKYVEEALKCRQIEAHRATVVFLWSGAIRVVRERMLLEGVTNVNKAIQKHHQNAKKVSRIADFAYIRDIICLQACETLGVFDKGERGILEDALNLRNKCGHPTKYSPGAKKVSGFIEDLVSVVFSKP